MQCKKKISNLAIFQDFTDARPKVFFSPPPKSLCLDQNQWISYIKNI